MAFAEGRLKVVGIGGTLREGSTSPGALRRVLAASEEAEVELLYLNELELPVYESRCSLDDYGDNVWRLVEAFLEADASIISTAAYHGTLAGVTKNALDYARFLGKEEHPYFDGKVVGPISTAGGEQVAANAAMVHVAHAPRGIVAPLIVGITKARRRTDERGEITDDNYGGRLDDLGGLVVELAQKLRTGGPIRRAESVGAVA